MDKIQLEKMRDFFPQKITYEEISAILLAIILSVGVRRYSVKSTKRFCKKTGFVPGNCQSFLVSLYKNC